MRPKTFFLLTAMLLIALVPLAVIAVASAAIPLAKVTAALTALSSVALGMAFQRQDEDAATKVTRAMPDGNESVNSTGIDLGHGGKGDFVAPCELRIEAPAVTTVELPNTETFVYDLYHSAASDFTGEALLQDNALTQTGAGGAGAAAATVNVRLPVDVNRHIRLKIAGSTLATDTTAKSAIMRLVF